MQHYRKTKRTYDNFLRNDPDEKACQFCASALNEPVLDENDTMYVIANRVAYDMFEGYPVLDHLMVIPKQHRASIANFTQDEALDHMKLVGKYEAMSYSVYSRGLGSASRSVAHQHTHLIKLGHTAAKTVFYRHRPYMLIVK